MLCCLAATVILATGCARNNARSGVMNEVDAVDIPPRELRLRMYVLQTRLAVDIERAADAVILASDDGRVDHNALL
jgi:hypothetical protein